MAGQAYHLRFTACGLGALLGNALQTDRTARTGPGMAGELFVLALLVGFRALFRNEGLQTPMAQRVFQRLRDQWFQAMRTVRDSAYRSRGGQVDEPVPQLEPPDRGATHEPDH